LCVRFELARLHSGRCVVWRPKAHDATTFTGPRDTAMHPCRKRHLLQGCAPQEWRADSKKTGRALCTRTSGCWANSCPGAVLCVFVICVHLRSSAANYRLLMFQLGRKERSKGIRHFFLCREAVLSRRFRLRLYLEQRPAIAFAAFARGAVVRAVRADE